MGKLIALSAKNNKAIDYENALKHPLCPIPLSIESADDSQRKTTKSKLMEEMSKKAASNMSYLKTNVPAKNNVSAFIVDLMPCIRQLTEIPSTYEELTWKILRSLPVGYSRVDIVADTYCKSSIKTVEREARGVSSEIHIKTPKSIIPKDFNVVLNNGNNKRKINSKIEVL